VIMIDDISMQDNGVDSGIVLKGKYIWVFFGAMAIFFYLAWNKDKKYRDEVIRDYSFTQGQIIHYTDNLGKSVEGRDIFVEYSYQVDSKVFSRKVRTQEIDGCADSSDSILPKCSEKRFWVIYSNNDHDKSLINLRFELQKEDSSQFPKSLDNFY
jgi:hypothetical protein